MTLKFERICLRVEDFLCSLPDFIVIILATLATILFPLIFVFQTVAGIVANIADSFKRF